VNKVALDFSKFSEQEQALMRRPLKLTASQAQRLVDVACRVDASIWRAEMGKLQAHGFTPRHPQWEQVSLEKTVPWMECTTQLALTTGMSFCEVLQLTVRDLRLSTCERHLAAIGRHQLTAACSGLLEVMLTLSQEALFPWDDSTKAAQLWLRACRNAGLLRGQPTKRPHRLNRQSRLRNKTTSLHASTNKELNHAS
jgi:hypothetical protein